MFRLPLWLAAAVALGAFALAAASLVALGVGEERFGAALGLVGAPLLLLSLVGAGIIYSKARPVPGAPKERSR
jgi:hypothetical protein